MARRPSRLSVWCYGERVAELTPTRPWKLICRTRPTHSTAGPATLRSLSCSLPLSACPHDASIFCAGLLPEGHRLALAECAAFAGKRRSRDARALRPRRRRCGRRRRGRTTPREPSCAVLAADLAREVEELNEHPLAVYDDSELSIAGLQDKMLLVDSAKGDGAALRTVNRLPTSSSSTTDSDRDSSWQRPRA